MSKGQALIRCGSGGWAGAAGMGSSGGLSRPEFRHGVRVGPGQDCPRRENLGRRRHAGRAERGAPAGAAQHRPRAAHVQSTATTRGQPGRRLIYGHEQAQRARSRQAARSTCQCMAAHARPRQQASFGSGLTRSQPRARSSCLGPRGPQTYHTDGSRVSFRVVRSKNTSAGLSGTNHRQ